MNLTRKKARIIRIVILLAAIASAMGSLIMPTQLLAKVLLWLGIALFLAAAVLTNYMKNLP